MKLFDLIIYGATFSVEYKVLDGQGETWIEKQVIYLNEAAPLAYQKRTLLHEILHVVLIHNGQYNVEAATELSNIELKEHLLIEPLSIGIYDVIKTNPQLEDWLWG